MSNYGLMSRVHEIFPHVTAEVEKYTETNPNRQSRSLARHLAGEATLYDQFVRKLLLRSHCPSVHDDSLTHKAEERLGVETVTLLTNKLRQLDDLLRALKADLANTSRGTEVLDRLRPRTTTSQAKTKPSFQKRLDELSRINKHLAAYISDSRPSLPIPTGLEGLPNFPLVFHRSHDKTDVSFHVISQGYACSCQGIHITGLDGEVLDPQFKGSWRSDWACEFLLPPHITLETPATTTPVPAVYGPDPPAQGLPTVIGGDNAKRPSQYRGPPFASIQRNTRSPLNSNIVCTAKQTNDDRSSSSSRRLGNATGGKDEFHNYLDDLKSRQPATVLADLIRRGRATIDQRRRLELAMGLTSAVVPLSFTQWTDRLWKWNEWNVTFDQIDVESVPNHSFCRQLYSVGLAVKAEDEPDAPWRVLAREPILAKLGITLIEIAFGRSLAEIRRDHLGFFPEEDAQKLGADVLDILTAKRLLGLRWIRDELCLNFENAVSACINQQYREARGGGVKELDIKDPSYLASGILAIIAPLHQELSTYFSDECSFVRRDGIGKPGLDFSQLHENEASSTVVKDDAFDGRTFRTADLHGDHESVTAVSFRSTQNFDYPNSSRGGVPEPSLLHRQAGDLATTLTSHPSIREIATSPPSHTSGPDLTIKARSVKQYPDRSAPGLSPPPVPSDPAIVGVALRRADVEQDAPRRGRDIEPLTSRVAGPAPNTGNKDRDYIRPVSSHESDFDAVSNFSYDTSSSCGDSEFSFLSNYSMVHPNLPENHPYLKIKENALSLVISKFQDYISTRGNGDQSGSPGRERQNGSAKQGRRHGRERGNFEDSNGDYSGSPNVQLGTGETPGDAPKLNFACPFFKKDPGRYHKCSTHTLTRIRDVKQHLRRKHPIPIYCSICYLTFREEHRRDSHAQQQACNPFVYERPEGVTKQQDMRLSKRPAPGQSDMQQWYAIFEILFPGYDPKPASPYLNPDVLENMMGYHQFLVTEGVGMLRSYIQSQGFTIQPPPSANGDLEAFLQQVFRDGFQTLFDHYTTPAYPGASTASVADASTNQTANSADSFSDVPGDTPIHRTPTSSAGQHSDPQITNQPLSMTFTSSPSFPGLHVNDQPAGGHPPDLYWLPSGDPDPTWANLIGNTMEAGPDGGTGHPGVLPDYMDTGRY